MEDSTEKQCYTVIVSGMDGTEETMGREKWRTVFSKAGPWLLGLLASAGTTVFACINVGSAVCVLLAIAYGALFHFAPRPERREDRRATRILAMIYTALLVIGGYSDYAVENYMVLRVAAAVVVGFGLFPLIDCICGMLLVFYLRRGEGQSAIEAGTPEDRRVFMRYAALCLLCYLPYYLILFPGRLSGDSVNQIQQAFGMLPLNNKHPTLHTFMIAICCRIGERVFHSMNGGVAVYSTVQMLMGVLSFSYALTVLRRLGASRLVMWLSFCFYALMLYNPWYSLTMWKDVPFALHMLLFTVRLVWMLRRQETLRNRDWILYGLIALPLCMLRHSGAIAFLVTAPFLLYQFRRALRAPLVATITVAALTLLLYGPVYSAFEIRSSDAIEALSVPAQQIARVYAEELPVPEIEDAILAEIVDTECLAEVYDERISDPVKWAVRSKGEQERLVRELPRYAAAWIKLGARYPGTYLRAYIAQTRNYWFPIVQRADHVVNVGAEGGELGIQEQPLLGRGLRDLLVDISRQHVRTPIYGLLFSIGLFTFVLIFTIYLTSRKHLPKLPCLPVLINLVLILLGTPVADEFRYAYNLVITVPFLLAACLTADRKERMERLPSCMESCPEKREAQG